MPRIVIAGSLAQRPNQGGHAWVFGQYIQGWQRLGYEVLFLDMLDPSMCVNHAGELCAFRNSVNAAYFVAAMKRFGCKNYSLTCASESIGITRCNIPSLVRGAEFLFNVMGYLADADILAAARRRVFLDIDPGFGQMWRDLELHDMFTGHDAYVTIGENIGAPDCTVPSCGIEWITTRQPVVLEQWPVCEGGESFTSIASWRGIYGPIEYHGTTYGLRCHEFRRFAGLPRETGQRFELALDIHPAEVPDLELLRDEDWNLVDPLKCTASPDDYQKYICQSKAEWMVAKNMYAQSRGGWFSDRSICYLASGKPVLAQDTGAPLPSGDGLLFFSSPEEAREGVAKINANYAHHCRAARAVAEEFFDSDKVLARLTNKLMK